MPFDIDEIKSEITAGNGILRTNKFIVRFTPPPGLVGNPMTGAFIVGNADTLGDIYKKIHLYCEAATIPGVQLDAQPVRRFGYGPTQKKPFAPSFTDAGLVFRADSNGTLWKYLHAWVRLAINYENRDGIGGRTGILPNQYPYQLAYHRDYVSDIHLTTYNEAGDAVLTTVLRQAYPIFIGDIQMGWEDKNNYLKIPTSFTFTDFYQETPRPITGQAPFQGQNDI
jgi:hypothetical protein